MMKQPGVLHSLIGVWKHPELKELILHGQGIGCFGENLLITR